jgi:hypothetical protein
MGDGTAPGGNGANGVVIITYTPRVFTQAHIIGF